MNAATQIQKAIACENRGDLAGAVAEYERVIKREPGHVDALFLLGRAHCMQGQFETGADAFKKVVKLRPGHAPAHTLLGMALLRLGKPEQALASLDRALAADPRFELALANRADVLAELGRHADAVAEYDKALTVNGGNVATWCNRGNALQVLGRDAEAIESFQRALALNPDLAEAHFNLANALHKLKRSEEAVRHYRRATVLRPGWADACINLGSALIVLRLWREAAEVSTQAVKLRPDSLLAHYNLGFALLELGRFDESRTHIDLALAIDPNYAPALHEKGRLLVYTGGPMDQAQAFAERAVATDPQQIGYYRLLADLKQFTPGDPLIETMEGLLRSAESNDVGDQAYLHFALAKAYRDTRQEKVSFDHLVRANALARQKIKYDEHAAIGSVERIRTVFSPELLRSKAGPGNPSAQPIFIVGMPRSGTTLIEQILASHPDVWPAGERPDLSNAIRKFAAASSSEYPELIANLTPAQIGDIGTTYLATMAASAPGAAARFTDKMPPNCLFVGLIHLALPNARIIHARRDPVDTCLSCFSINFSEPLPYAYDLGELGRYYRAYERLMQHWRDVLPDDAMLDVQYEDVVADLETHARRIVAYCGLQWNDACLAFHEAARPVTTASATQVRQPIYRSSVGRWRAYKEQLGPLLEALGEVQAQE